jgi:hypothetical protein
VSFCLSLYVRYAQGALASDKTSEAASLRTRQLGVDHPALTNHNRNDLMTGHDPLILYHEGNRRFSSILGRDTRICLVEGKDRFTNDLSGITAALPALRKTYVKDQNTRTISGAGRARIAAAQRARWAKAKVVPIRGNGTLATLQTLAISPRSLIPMARQAPPPRPVSADSPRSHLILKRTTRAA